jgi:hypothetical protein
MKVVSNFRPYEPYGQDKTEDRSEYGDYAIDIWERQREERKCRRGGNTGK